MANVAVDGCDAEAGRQPEGPVAARILVGIADLWFSRVVSPLHGGGPARQPGKGHGRPHTGRQARNRRGIVVGPPPCSGKVGGRMAENTTLAVNAGPGDGERLYRAAADVFGLPAWHILLGAAQSASLGDFEPEAFSALRLVLLPGACMVQTLRDGKARGAMVNADGSATVLVKANDPRQLVELFGELVQVLEALPGDTVLQVHGSPSDLVIAATAAKLIGILGGVIRDASSKVGKGEG